MSNEMRYAFADVIHVQGQFDLMFEFELTPKDHQLMGEYMSDRVEEAVTYGENLIFVVLNRMHRALDVQFETIDNNYITVKIERGNDTLFEDNNDRYVMSHARLDDRFNEYELGFMLRAVEAHAEGMWDHMDPADQMIINHTVEKLKVAYKEAVRSEPVASPLERKVVELLDYIKDGAEVPQELVNELDNIL